MSRPHRLPHTRLKVISGQAVRMPRKCPKTGKDNFVDRIQADLALGDILRRIRRRETEPKRSYKCNLCPWWHHTSQDHHNPQIAHSA